MNKTTNIIIAVLIVLMVGSWISDQNSSSTRSNEVKYSEFMKLIQANRVNNVVVDESNRLIFGEDTTNGTEIRSVMPNDEKLIDTLVGRGIAFEVKQPETCLLYTSPSPRDA